MSSFWTDASERHREIAETFYRNIEYKNPEQVTSRGMCVCLNFSTWCSWASTNVEYPEYTGPDVKHI